MRRWILAVAMTAITATPFAAVAATGKDVFTDQKCAKCHKISSEGIAATEEKEKIIDLSGTGKDHDVAWFKGWLNKEIERDSAVKPGEKAKHKIKFKGTPAELDTLAAWLKTLTKK